MFNVLTGADAVDAAGRIVAVTESQQTQRVLTALIALLLVVAAMLAILTIWYWRHTSPRRQMEHFFADIDDGGVDPDYHLDVDQGYYDDENQLIDLDNPYYEAQEHNYR